MAPQVEEQEPSEMFRSSPHSSGAMAARPDCSGGRSPSRNTRANLLRPSRKVPAI